MTPEQRKFDTDLADSMLRMANWIEPRSRKVALTLRTAAVRLKELTTGMRIEPTTEIESKPSKIQPASTPVQPNR